MALLKPAAGGVRSIVEKLRRPLRDAAANNARTAHSRRDRADGAALTLNKAAQAGAARGRRSQILTGALLLSAVTGGVLLVRARERPAPRSGAKGVGLGAAGHRGSEGIEEPDPSAKDYQEALLDEGLEESFPASDPVSVNRIT